MDIAVTMYPVSMIINGYNHCDLMAKTREGSEYGHVIYYTNGVEDLVTSEGINTITTWILPAGGRLDFDQDQYPYDYEEESEPPAGYFNGKMGYGIYKVIIRTHPNPPYDADYPPHIDSFTIDQDLTNQLGDHWVHFRDDNNTPKTYFQYQFEPENQWIRINNTEYSHYRMEPWIHYGRDRQHGNAIYLNQECGNQYLFPLDSRRDCNRILPTPPLPPFDPLYQNQNHIYGDARSGNLTVNLTLSAFKETPIENNVINFPTFINVLKYDIPIFGVKKCSLIVDVGSLFWVRSDSWYTLYWFSGKWNLGLFKNGVKLANIFVI
jgi:hypothetical protein